MNRLIFIISLLISLLTITTSCKQTKYVPEGKHLLKKNVIKASKSEISNDDFADIIRQKPNYKTLGLKLKLAAYNAVDSAKVADKRIRKNEKLKIKNQKLRTKEKRINEKRIARAKRKNKEWYTQRIIPLKDTTDPKMFFREWLKYKFGEPPVIFDTTYYNKSIEQLQVFLRKKGYYYGNVSGEIAYKDNKKAIVTYKIEPGSRYYIDSVYLVGSNESVKNSYRQFFKKGKVEPLRGKPFDTDILDDHRSYVAGLMRDEAYYGFNYSSIDYIADTNKTTYKVKLGLRFSDRLIQSPDNPDSVISVPYRPYLVKDVHFHILDTLKMYGLFKQQTQELGLPISKDGNLTTLDTMVFSQIYFNRNEKIRRGIDPKKDSLNTQRIANFYYNGKMFIKPGIVELQNYLENENYYKEYYLERSYSRLLQLDVFSVVKPQLIEIPGTNLVEVHYFLAPSEKQHFSFEPKATNSNGFLGISASINYNNRNLFRGAEKFTFTLSGGFESQPPIFDESVDGEKIQKAGRSFNTFEFEPGVKLDLPGLLPLRRAVYMAKRQRARTIISLSMNYQKRSDFDRKSFQFSYMWRFYGDATQIFQIGMPLTSTIKYVNIDRSDDFTDKLNQLNDIFLRSTYSDQFIWQDWKITYEYNTTDKKNKRSKANVYYKTSFDPAGNFVSLFKNSQDTNELGQRTIFGLGYSQFLRLDNEIIYAQPIGKKHSFNWRFLAGAGMPYGNSKTSLPYDYSFFGGGANDNRGWRSRALGPGVYKYYLDPTRTATQIGDIRIATSAEFRVSLGGMFKFAVFSDIGNVWTWNEDVNRPGSQFTKDWYKQLAVSGGVGLRLDLSFFVVRLDFGVPLSNPSLPKGSRWIFQSRNAFNNEINSIPGLDLSTVPKPFIPIFHFGIGYPF
ncbi:MAG TPA: BamA/TamA family outer membrane protein [Taishania sp.]|nr:BamA/TamA family outer membrane protein [Taishania sp.]